MGSGNVERKGGWGQGGGKWQFSRREKERKREKPREKFDVRLVYFLSLQIREEMEEIKVVLQKITHLSLDLKQNKIFKIAQL